LDVIFGTLQTSGRKRSNSRLSIGPPSTMPSLGDQRSPDSWQSPIMHISSCGCLAIEDH
jgi:hypothetical protein